MLLSKFKCRLLSILLCILRPDAVVLCNMVALSESIFSFKEINAEKEDNIILNCLAGMTSLIILAVMCLIMFSYAGYNCIFVISLHVSGVEFFQIMLSSYQILRTTLKAIRKYFYGSLVRFMIYYIHINLYFEILL